MVTLDQIEASNAQVKTALPERLVAVFIGATRGIGEATMREFVKSVKTPKIYFTGRSRAGGEKIAAEYKTLNPAGQYIFIQADTSLIKACDEVCDRIKTEVTAVNLLFISSGTLILGTTTPENLPYGTSLSVFSRIRITMNLLPLLSAAPGLRRVVTVFAGTKEGNVAAEDFPAIKVPVLGQRGHASSMITLSFESLAKEAPGVSFVHSFPGFVKTDLAKEVPGAAMMVLRSLFKVIGPFVNIPIEEVGKRHLYLCTSGRYPAADAPGVPLTEGEGSATPTQGEGGAAVYSTDSAQDAGGEKMVEVLSKLRGERMGDKVMEYQISEFQRITQK